MSISGSNQQHHSQQHHHHQQQQSKSHASSSSRKSSWKSSFHFGSIMASQESVTSSASSSSLSSTGAAAADHGHLVVVPKDPKVVTALFKYKGAKDSSIGGAFSKQAPNELSFKKGEKMILLDVVEETDSSSGELSRPGWWLACKRSETDKSGYIPLNYVTVDLTSKDWYYANINRQETERLLMEPFVEQGSFLVRKRAKDLKPDYLILCLRHQNSVKHYLIQKKAKSADGGGNSSGSSSGGDEHYFINPECTFSRLEHLIEHYSATETIELNFQRLTKPMPKEGRRSTAMSTVAEAIELKDSIDQHSSVAAASSSNGRIAGNCPEVKVKRLEFSGELPHQSTDRWKLFTGTYKVNSISSSINTLRRGSKSILSSSSSGSGSLKNTLKKDSKKVTRQAVAIKRLEAGSSLSATSFFHEAIMLNGLQHENVLSLVGVCTEKSPLIVTELLDRGDLLAYLREHYHHEEDLEHENHRHREQNELKELLSLAAQVAAAMSYLEGQKVILRNLMARNCLVGGGLLAENPTVKVGNFSQARRLPEAGPSVYLQKGVKPADKQKSSEQSSSSSFSSSQLPIKWTAPEAALQGIFSAQSDVWSFGVLLYEVLTRGSVPPYQGLSCADALEQVERAGLRMSRPPLCPEPLYQIMLECWEASAERRPEFKYLYCYLDNFYTGDVQNEAETISERCEQCRGLQSSTTTTTTTTTTSTTKE